MVRGTLEENLLTPLSPTTFFTGIEREKARNWKKIKKLQSDKSGMEGHRCLEGNGTDAREENLLL